MPTMTAIVRNGQLELPRPIDLLDGLLGHGQKPARTSN
jgi:hypothetical protein